jgi:F-type H+-transporting ATPase subunit b
MPRILTILAVAAALLPAVALGAEGGEERALINPLVSEMIFSLVVFTIFFLALAFLVWPKILGALQSRESKIKDDLETAEQGAKEAAATLEQYKQQLADAQAESQKVIEQARKDADRVAAQLKDEAQTQITAMRDRATRDIAAAKEQAIADLYDQAGTLATHVAGRILQREIRPEDQQQLITESLNQLKNQNN